MNGFSGSYTMSDRVIRRYEDSDYEEVMSWLDARNIPRIHQNVLPAVGFIVPGHAVVWLYQTDSDFCQIENLYSNPASIEKRKYVDLVIDTAIKAARELGYKFVQSTTSHPSVIKRAVKLGAKTQTLQTLITLQIK